MKISFTALALAASALFTPHTALAQTEIQWWHSMGGALGEWINDLANDFNKSQTEYKIVATFKGEAQFAERDDVNFKASLKASGRDTGGKGNASALITAELTALTETSTSVTVNTDLSVTGKVAQFGRGAMADISDKLLAQFVVNLNEMIAASDTAPVEAAAPVAETPAPAPAAASATDAPAEPAQPTVRKIDGPEAEALDLLSISRGVIVKRALPVVVVVAAIVIWFIAK